MNPTDTGQTDISALAHDHVFLGADHARNEHKVWLVIALTATMIVIEIAADTLYASMALVADGWLWATRSWGLIRDAGGVLLDTVPDHADILRQIREMVETDGDRITDLHVWQIGPGHHAAIIALASQQPKPPSDYKAQLAHIHTLSHITIEAQPTR
tara:strand:+ start:321 stop:791 length:471 start_codon:yes stop_codon:yes gene_type:complete